MMYNKWRNSISIDIDVDDILNQISDEDILSYVEENHLINTDEQDPDKLDEQKLVSYIEYIMNGKNSVVIPRTKKELKEYVCELIDYWHKSRV